MSRRPPVPSRTRGLALRSAFLRQREGGVTLLEMILVMMIIFTLATVVLPRFSEFFPSLQVRTAADRLLAWSGKARAEAALTGTRHRLVLDPAGKAFWISWEPKPLKEPGKFERLEGAWDRETLPVDVVFETIEGFETDPDAPATRFLEFDPDGSTVEASVDVANDRGDRRTLRVAAATGAASIENPNDPDAEGKP